MGGKAACKGEGKGSDGGAGVGHVSLLWVARVDQQQVPMSKNLRGIDRPGHRAYGKRANFCATWEEKTDGDA
jgi:hypothetical protein